MPDKIIITYDKFVDDCKQLANKLDNKYDSVYAIPRGGVPVGLVLSQVKGLKLIESTDKITDSTLIVDDLVDSGSTMNQFKGLYPNNDFAVLYVKPHSPLPNYSVEFLDGWIVLPYEETEKDEKDIVVRLLEVLGEDPTREGLLDTPKRVLKFYREFLSVPEFNFTTFDSEGYDEMIVQKNIPFFSLCEHHMAPFFGTATVAYIPDKKIVGLSKLARTVKLYAGNLQNQERITSQVADRLEKELNPIGVAVILEARHFCMEMRGVKTTNTTTTTSKLTGVFRNPEVRAELMAIVNNK